ncbi:hypothetical protein EYC84_008430 [Monilinia fructicola]|uniref:Uncharacterized protein n=1 Tax=Monilinia fructicola TaxID=38448 RepID=A0A5M9JLT5_MONFR|nr:hypothetical protein EYC84_008430 [Monilinia fructicola]
MFVQVVVDVQGAKDTVIGTTNKENCSAPFDIEEDAELMRLIEEQFARPTTPTQKNPCPKSIQDSNSSNSQSQANHQKRNKIWSLG